MADRRLGFVCRFVVCALASASGFMPPQTAHAQWVVLHSKNASAARNIPAEPLKVLIDAARKGSEIKCVAFAPDGGWVVLYGKNSFTGRNIPPEAQRILAEQQKKGSEFRWMTFSPNGGWALFAGNSSFALNIGEGAFQKLGEYVKKNQRLQSITFTPNGGWIILTEKNNYFGWEIGKELMQKLDELGLKNPEFKHVVFAPNGAWAVLYNKNSIAAAPNFPEELLTAVKDLQKKGVALKSISFLTTSFVPLSKDDQETRDEVLWRMNRAEVPGLGIAVVNNGKLAWARGYGVLQAKADQPVTEHTRFQAGSISQLLSTLAALRLVQQGRLGLDQPLNDKLTAWKVPDNEFTRKKPPSLRHLLCHSAGFNVPAVALTPKSSFTLLEVLEGKADTPAVQVEFVPGTKVETSAGGYLVLQHLLCDVAGKPFPELAQEQVLAPLGMSESTFEHPLPKDQEAVAAVGHLADQQPLLSRWHDCNPALAAAGLWTTPTDLARVIVALSLAHQSKPDAVLTRASGKEMFNKQVADMGLGAELAGTGKSLSYSVRGANAGYTCYIVGYPATGQGAVLMTNSDTGDKLIKELLQSLRMEYGWPEGDDKK